MPNVAATKALQKRADAALEAFHNYYAAIWGSERWHERLYPALTQATRHVAVVNKLGGQEFADTFVEQLQSTVTLLDGQSISQQLCYPVALGRTGDQTFPQPTRVSNTDGEALMNYWLMDLASVIAATALQVEPGHTVLDLCAAPGGKSVVLSQMLLSSQDPAGCLHSNEDDHTRNKRLAANLQAYIPRQHFDNGTVKVLRIDGTSKSAITDLPLGKQGYDRILVDAPCSSERHIIQAHVKASSSRQIAPEMSNWKSSHSKTLAKTQSALLMTAFKALKVGGRLVYATCSISNEENDDVVERTLEALKRERKKGIEKMKWNMEIDDSQPDETLSKLFEMAERTKYGRIVLPDHGKPDGWGPLYFAIMRKVSID